MKNISKIIKYESILVFLISILLAGFYLFLIIAGESEFFLEPFFNCILGVLVSIPLYGLSHLIKLVEDIDKQHKL